MSTAPGMFSSRTWRLAALMATVPCAVALALSLGVAKVSLTRALHDGASVDAAILGARAARVALGAIAGGALALVGASFQALLRNPLGDPYALGVSGGAALGATIAVVLGVATRWVPAAAFVGALGATVVVLLASHASGRVGVGSMLLAGMVLNACASAALTLVRSVSTSGRAQETLSLLLGVVNEEPAVRVAEVGMLVAFGALVLIALGHAMNLLAHGDDAAASLGLSVERARAAVFVASSVVVAAVVSVCGLIPFVGLVVPHYVRAVVGTDHRWLLPGCLAAGATILVLADLAVRMLFVVAGTEAPVGALTALVGAPIFLAMLRALRDES